MARIAGVNIPNEKRIEASLPYVFGIGPSNTKVILVEAGIDPNKRTKDLTESELEKIRTIIGRTYRVEGDLKMEINQNIKRLKEIGAYRGTRHTKNLPVKGQRTKTNARTKRGKKITMGSGRKSSAQKT